MPQLIRHLLLLLLLCGASVAHAAYDEQRVANLYREALELQLPPSAELSRYDALVTLQKEPTSAVAWRVLRSETPNDDATLAALCQTLSVLKCALDGELEDYRTQALALRKSVKDPALLKLANISDALTACSFCNWESKCRTCDATGRCKRCRGRGILVQQQNASSFQGSSNFSLKNATKTRSRCPACNGSGKCPDCKGGRTSCEFCRDTGKVPDKDKLKARISQLAEQAVSHLNSTLKPSLSAREQTQLMSADLQRLQGIQDPEKALTQIDALPEARQQSVQWSHVAKIRAELEAWRDEKKANSAQKQAQRTALRNAIAQAQRLPDPLKGMTALLPLFAEYHDCDALPEVQVALNGLFITASTQRAEHESSLRKRIASIRALQNPADRIAQAESAQADFAPQRIPEALRSYAQTSEWRALAQFIKDDPISPLLADLAHIRTQAQQAQEQDASQPWWIWAGGGLLALLVLYAIGSAIASALEKRKEAQRKAQQRAAIESIRNTFSHRHKH